MSELEDLLLPAGTRLVHIGPHKTGTTAIQRAFDRSRKKIAEQGVHYAWKTGQAYIPAIALTRNRGIRGTGYVAPTKWDELVAEVDGYGEDRVLISSESFCNAETEHIVKLRDDIGADRVHIVRMVRRFDLLLPSQWQQNIVAARRSSWEPYLQAVLADGQHPFWRRHSLTQLTRRWADVVGPDRVSVVVVDDGDRDWLPRVMAAMLGLPREVLDTTSKGVDNRSLTWAEADMLQRINQAFGKRGWSDAAHLRYIRKGVKNALKPFAPEPSEGRASVPASALPELERITRAQWEELNGLGVRVVGELDWLLPTAPRSTDDVGTPRLIRVDKVAAAAAAIVDTATGPKRVFLGTAGTPEIEPPAVPVPKRRLFARSSGRATLAPDGQRLLAAVDAARTWTPEQRKDFLDEGLVPWLATVPDLGDSAPADDGTPRIPAKAAGVALCGILSRVPWGPTG